MLRQLWRWLMGTPGPSRTDVLLETFIEGQQKIQTSMLQAVATISEASAEQSKVLGQYLSLFSQPGEPQGWTHPEFDVEQNTLELAAMGFPAEGSEAEQAKWVLDNLEKL